MKSISPYARSETSVCDRTIGGTALPVPLAFRANQAISDWMASRASAPRTTQSSFARVLMGVFQSLQGEKGQRNWIRETHNARVDRVWVGSVSSGELESKSSQGGFARKVRLLFR
eukprot:3761222-Amphidinium_carterae.1